MMVGGFHGVITDSGTWWNIDKHQMWTDMSFKNTKSLEVFKFLFIMTSDHWITDGT